MKKRNVNSRMRCFLLFLAFFALALFSCISAMAETGDAWYVRTVFNRTNGLPTDEANAVLQTSDGYLWVASFGGLLRYNGTTFRNFSAEGAIATPSIRTLFEDSVGRLWIGSSDGGVFVYENNTFTPIPRAEKVGYLSIRDFVEADDGTIYVASTSGVCVIRDGVMIPLEDSHIKGETVYSLAFDPYGRLWCAMNNGSCVVLQNDSFASVLTPDVFFTDGSIVTCLTADKEHNIYLGTDKDLLAKVSFTGSALDGADFSLRIYTVKDATRHNRISVRENGDMFVSGQKGFAWVTPDGGMRDAHTAKTTDSVNCATMDYEGNVWLASSNEGLVRYTPGCFSTPNAIAELDGVSINAVTMADGAFYLATEQGVLAFNTHWHRIKNTITESLDGVPVKNLMVDSKGRLWCGTYSTMGVVRYHPGTNEMVSFNAANGLDSTRVRVSYEMADGTVAVGTQDGLALIKDDAVVAFYDKDNGMETQSILCLVQIPDGTLLAGSAGSGIYALSPDGKLTTFSYEQGLNDGVVLRIVLENPGTTAFVSAGSHLYYWTAEGFRLLDNVDIGSGSIFDMFVRDDRLWLMQDSGLYSVDTAKLLSGGAAHATKYGTGDGLTGSLIVNTWNYKSPAGTLYLATRSGISIFDFPVLYSFPPRLVVDTIRVDGETFEQPETLMLSSNARRMTISFSALSYSGAADLCLGYQLIGFAKNETKLYDVTSGSVSYTNLSGGNYTFRLRVFDPDNPEEQQIIEIPIVKEKKLIEQPLAWVVIFLLFGAAIICLAQVMIHLKMKRLREQRQIYRNIVGQALRTFANTIDAKDPYTNGHSFRVAIYAREITRRLGYSENDQESVYYIALLHDIGKIAVPDSILKKVGPLTPEERAIVQTHPVKGGEILRDFTALSGIADGARYHHERYDGKGYCEGLSGEEIPLMGRIICVADSYDAMSSDRCYRKALTQEQILEELQKGSGTQFDPHIAAIMIEMIEDGFAPIPEQIGIKELSNSVPGIQAQENNENHKK